MRQNTEQVRDWLHPGDIMVVDRGIRDSADLLSEIGNNPLLKRNNTDMILLYDYCGCIFINAQHLKYLEISKIYL